MGFDFNNKQMTVLEILDGTKKDIVANIDFLAKVYLEKTGRKVCRSCPSDMNYMILSLKNIFKMTQFKFKRHAAQYKIKKGDKSTIHNGNLTDEKAIAFLREDPARIVLFSVKPSNWETLLIDGADSESEEDKEKRLAAEAEAAAAAEGTNVKEEPGSEEATDEAIQAAEAAAKAAAEIDTDTSSVMSEEMEAAAEMTGANAVKMKSEELLKMQLKDLRAMFPEISAASIKDFVAKLVAEGKAEE